jgi:hypothetical protein
MTLAVDQPHQPHWVRRSEVVTPSGVRATVRPLSAPGVGLLAALVGAWGGICVFVGPYFGYRPTSATTWQWTTNNWLLHLLPGAVALAAGVMIMTLSPVRRGAGVRSALGLAALVVTAAGAWFVIGPALWPTFQSTPAYATGTGAWTSFWNQLGANLGPGVLLAFFGGMALKASIARPALAVGEPAEAAARPEAVGPAAGANRGLTGAEAGRESPEARQERVRSDEEAATTSQPAAADYRRADETRGPVRAGSDEDMTTTSQPAAADYRPADETRGPVRAGSDEDVATTSQPAVDDPRRADETGGPARA